MFLYFHPYLQLASVPVTFSNQKGRRAGAYFFHGLANDQALAVCHLPVNPLRAVPDYRTH